MPMKNRREWTVMAKYLLITTMLAFGIAAQDITVSKDSLKVYNNLVSSFADDITFTSNVPTAIRLDSVFLLIDEMDTTGLSWDITEERLQGRWRESLGSPLWFNWDLERNGEKKYRMMLQSSSPADTQPLYFDGQGTQRGIAMMAIGGCIRCSGLPPRFPPYIKGMLVLYFSNGQTVSLRLYSDDLREPASYNEPCEDYACDSMNVRKILDRNGMESVPVSEVTSSGNRVTTLSLVYNLAGAVSLPKQCTVLPDEIGNLTALISIMARGNAFESISPRIGRCSKLTTIFADNNGISALPDSIVRCRQLRYITLENNRLIRIPDSIGKLRSLRQLSVTNNLLTSLPASIVELDSMDCVFVAGNRICTLPEVVKTWLTDVRTNSLCERWEPVWPDSQECETASAKLTPAGQRVSLFTVKRIVREGNFIVMETDAAGGVVRLIEIFDCSGKRIEAIIPSAGRHFPGTVRLNATRYPAGWYYMRVISETSIATGCSFVIER